MRHRPSPTLAWGRSRLIFPARHVEDQVEHLTSSRRGIRWRNAYVDGRVRQGVAGFAQYYFRFENARTFVMQDALRALARGMAEI